MLTKTSTTALQSLVYIVNQERNTPIAPVEIADKLGASATYLSKINTHLVKAGILQAHRGTKGGVTLMRPPEAISLLEIVEACQGKILGDYCTQHDNLDEVCAFHVAMHELQEALISTLARWNLKDISKKPQPAEHLRDKVQCRMHNIFTS